MEAQSGWRSFVSVGSLVSGLLTAAVWGLQFPWVTGLYLVALLYAHEAGHVLAARWRGLPVLSPPIFLPGLGAYVLVGNAARPFDGVLMALGGPAVGGVAALAAKAAGVYWGNAELAFVGDFCLLVNLINLVPAAPFDGGRALEPAGNFGLWTAAGLTMYSARVGSPLLIGLGVFALLQQGYRVMTMREHPGTSVLLGLGSAAVYSSAVGLLVAAYMMTPRVPWLRVAAHPWQLVLNIVLVGVVVAYTLSRGLLRFAWTPGRGARGRYLILALLGWPQWLMSDPWFMAPAWCGLADSFGLPGLRWLRDMVPYMAARRRRPASFGIAVGYDLLMQRGSPEEASAWLTAMGPVGRAGGARIAEAVPGDLKLLGYPAAAAQWEDEL